MDNKLITVGTNVLKMAQNMHVNITLSGWPAAMSIIAVCGMRVAIYAISQAGTSKTTKA